MKFFIEAKSVKPKLGDKNVVILDFVSYPVGYLGNPELRYIEKHIPGAIKVVKSDLQDDLSDRNILPATKIVQKFLELGIDQNTFLIVYSDNLVSAGRLAFIAYWLGVDNVKIINGGLEAWQDLGYEIEVGNIEPQPKVSFGCNVPKRPEILISTPEDIIEQQTLNSDFVLASVRTWREFIGEIVGYSDEFFSIAGECKGAVYAKCSKFSNMDANYLVDANEKVYPLSDDILSSWEKWGITKNKQIAFYCGCGWRATIPFFLCKEIGWEKVQVFDGGNYQWVKYHLENPQKYPIQVGNPLDEESFYIKDYV